MSIPIERLQMIADHCFRDRAPELRTCAIRVRERPDTPRYGFHLELYVYEPSDEGEMRIGDPHIVDRMRAGSEAILERLVADVSAMLASHARALVFQAGMETLRFRHLKPAFDRLGEIADDLIAMQPRDPRD